MFDTADDIIVLAETEELKGIMQGYWRLNISFAEQ